VSAGEEPSKEPTIRRTRRHLPHWDLSGSTYFVTFRLAREVLSPEERRLVLDHVRSGAGTYYRLAAVVVMPDHVHLVIRPEDGFTLSRIMKGIKGVSARYINQHRGSSGTVWQDESWDRIIRDEGEFFGVLEYLVENPRKGGLCREPEEYEWLFINKET
jgi:putative transposase